MDAAAGFRWQIVRPSLQDEGGASRDEIAAALVEVAEGRVPKDRIALRELYREIMDWPFVEAAPEEEESEDGAVSSSPYEAITPTGVEGDDVFQLGWLEHLAFNLMASQAAAPLQEHCHAILTPLCLQGAARATCSADGTGDRSSLDSQCLAQVCM